MRFPFHLYPKPANGSGHSPPARWPCPSRPGWAHRRCRCRRHRCRCCRHCCRYRRRRPAGEDCSPYPYTWFSTRLIVVWAVWAGCALLYPSPAPAPRLTIVWAGDRKHLPLSPPLRGGGLSFGLCGHHISPPPRRQLIVVWVVALSSIPWQGG